MGCITDKVLVFVCLKTEDIYIFYGNFDGTFMINHVFFCAQFSCALRRCPKSVWGLCSSWRACWSSCGHACLSSKWFEWKVIRINTVCRIWGWVKTNDIPIMGDDGGWESIYQLWRHRDLAPLAYGPRHCGSCERESRAGWPMVTDGWRMALGSNL